MGNGNDVENIGIGNTDIDEQLRVANELGRDNSGSSAGTIGSGTGRKRGRPRKDETEEVQHLLNEEPVKRQYNNTRQSKSNDAFLRASIDIALMGTFQAIGTLISLTTDREDRPWWRLDSNQVSPISTPLCRYIDALPAHIRKKIDQYSMPAALLIGTVQVVGEPIRIEMEYSKLKAQHYANINGNSSNSNASKSVTNTSIPSNQGNDGYAQTINNGYQSNNIGRREFGQNIINNGHEFEDI